MHVCKRVGGRGGTHLWKNRDYPIALQPRFLLHGKVIQ